MTEAKLCDLACFTGLSLCLLARAEVTCRGTWVTRPSESTVIRPRLPRLSAPVACLVSTTPTLRVKFDNGQVKQQSLPVRSVESWPVGIARYGCVTDHPPVTQIFPSLSIKGFPEELAVKSIGMLMLWPVLKWDQRVGRAAILLSVNKSEEVVKGRRVFTSPLSTDRAALLHK